MALQKVFDQVDERGARDLDRMLRSGATGAMRARRPQARTEAQATARVASAGTWAQTVAQNSGGIIRRQTHSAARLAPKGRTFLVRTSSISSAPAA